MLLPYQYQVTCMNCEVPLYIYLILLCIQYWSWNSYISITTGLRDWWLELDSWQGQGIFLFTTMSRLALGPTQLPIQSVSGALFLRVNQLRCEAHHSSPSITGVKNAWSYTSILNLSSWCGAQLSKGYAFMVWYLVQPRDNFTFTFTFNIFLSTLFSNTCSSFSLKNTILTLLYTIRQCPVMSTTPWRCIGRVKV